MTRRLESPTERALALGTLTEIAHAMRGTGWKPVRRHSRGDVRLALGCLVVLVFLLLALALQVHLYGNRPAPSPCGDASSPAHPAGCRLSSEAPNVLP